MSKRGRWLKVLLVAALSPQVAFAADYFVGPGGSDGGAGLAGDPWATLQHAADTVAAGDTVHVAAGSYAGFDLRTSGAAGSPIVFQAQTGTVINTPNARTNRDGINLEAASHVVIDGFTITGMPRAGVRSVGSDGAHAQFVTIRNNRTDQNGQWGIFAGYVEDLMVANNETSRSAGEHGIYVSNSADRPTITGNVSWGNNASGIQINADGSLPGDGVISGALVSGNTIYDNGQSGGAAINLDGVQDSRVENNLIYDSHATGIALFRANGADASKNNQIVNNTVITDADGRWGITVADGSTGNTLLNNIFFSQHAFRGALDISNDSRLGLVSDFNVWENRITPDGGTTLWTLADWQALSGLDANSLVATLGDLFVDPDSGDYRLAALSPAIDAGTSWLAPSIDLFGAPRPIGAAVDIGAIEVPEPTTLLTMLGMVGFLGLSTRKRPA